MLTAAPWAPSPHCTWRRRAASWSLWRCCCRSVGCTGRGAVLAGPAAGSTGSEGELAHARRGGAVWNCCRRSGLRRPCLSGRSTLFRRAPRAGQGGLGRQQQAGHLCQNPPGRRPHAARGLKGIVHSDVFGTSRPACVTSFLHGSRVGLPTRGSADTAHARPASSTCLFPSTCGWLFNNGCNACPAGWS